MKKIILVFALVILFSGCQQKDIDEYNKISEQHYNITNSAVDEITKSVDFYNKKEFDKAIEYAKLCYSDYQKAKDLSVKSSDIAKKLKKKEWLVEFKDLSAKTENLRINQCKLLEEASNLSKDKKYDEAQAKINEISVSNDEFQKIESSLQDIKNQHQNDFK